MTQDNLSVYKNFSIKIYLVPMNSEPKIYFLYPGKNEIDEAQFLTFKHMNKGDLLTWPGFPRTFSFQKMILDTISNEIRFMFLEEIRD